MSTANAEPSPFDADVVAAVTRHMNEDHAGDCLLIVRGLGGQPDATSATMSGLTAAGIDFAATVRGSTVSVCVPWAISIATRADIRTEAVRMVRDASDRLGLPAADPHD